MGLALGGAGGAALSGWRARRVVAGLRLAEEEASFEIGSSPDLPPPAWNGSLEPTMGMVDWVENALKRLYDYGYLGEHPLAGLQVVRATGQVARLDLGREVHRLLVETFERLRPDGEEPEEPNRSWWPYLVLRDSYLLGDSRREIMIRLYMSEGTYNRVRKRGVRAVAKTLRDLEKQARWMSLRGGLPQPD